MIKEETGVGFATIMLGCIIIFSLIWSFGSLIKGDSRNKFDTFLRKLLLGNIDEYQKPATFRLTKANLFPDMGTVYDYVYDYKNNGSWVLWSEKLEFKMISPDARVNKSLNIYWFFFSLLEFELKTIVALVTLTCFIV